MATEKWTGKGNLKINLVIYISIEINLRVLFHRPANSTFLHGKNSECALLGIAFGYNFWRPANFVSTTFPSALPRFCYAKGGASPPATWAPPRELIGSWWRGKVLSPLRLRPLLLIVRCSSTPLHSHRAPAFLFLILGLWPPLLRRSSSTPAASSRSSQTVSQTARRCSPGIRWIMNESRHCWVYD